MRLLVRFVKHTNKTGFVASIWSSRKCTYRKTPKSSSRIITSAIKPLSKLFLIFGPGLSSTTPPPKTWKKWKMIVALNWSCNLNTKTELRYIQDKLHHQQPSTNMKWEDMMGNVILQLVSIIINPQQKEKKPLMLFKRGFNITFIAPEAQNPVRKSSLKCYLVSSWFMMVITSWLTSCITN